MAHFNLNTASRALRRLARAIAIERGGDVIADAWAPTTDGGARVYLSDGTSVAIDATTLREVGEE